MKQTTRWFVCCVHVGVAGESGEVPAGQAAFTEQTFKSESKRRAKVATRYACAVVIFGGECAGAESRESGEDGRQVRILNPRSKDVVAEKTDGGRAVNAICFVKVKKRIRSTPVILKSISNKMEMRDDRRRE